MDGLDEDDAHHPPTPHRQKPHRRNGSPLTFPRTHRRSLSESDGSERNTDEDPEDSEESVHSASSADSRGKRRKLDRYAHGFEFAPRKPPAPSPPTETTTATVLVNPKTNFSKNSEWSEDSTFILLDAWGEIFIQNGRKSLRSDQWSAVAEKVNRDPRIARSDSQCRNRIDTLKKKYKKEKIRLTVYPDLKSDWTYFTKMDYLMSPPSRSPLAVTAAEAHPVRLPCGMDTGEYVFSSSGAYTRRANGMDEMGDSPGDTGSSSEDDDNDDDHSDGLPPSMPPMRRKESATLRLLADSIRKFGEVYERVEIGKRKQMAEIERMRNDFQRDLEVQKRQILERANAKIARMRHRERKVEHKREEVKPDDDDANGGVGGVDGGDDIDVSTENLSD